MPTTMSCRLDGQTARADFTVTSAGPYALVLRSTLHGTSGLELVSTYLGHSRAITQITHLKLIAGAQPTAEHRGVPHDDVPVIFARQRCVLDHLAVLATYAQQHGHTLAVDVDDELLALAEHTPVSP